jgi:hypothetical protein
MSSGYILSDNGVSSGSAGLKSGGGNDGTLLLQTTTSGGAATTAVTVDNAQNVGVGVTPSAWWSSGNAIEMGGKSFNYIAFNGSTNGFLYTNAYYNGTNNIYKNSGYANYYTMTGGQHQWFTAPSGSAGGTITFTQAMTLDASGNLLVGATSAGGRLTVKGSTTDNSTTAITASDSAGTGLFYVRNDGLVNTGASTNSPYNATTASSANLLVTSSGTLSRATSALKYKTDVRDLESVDLTKFRPIRYKSTCENDDKTIDHIGFIADEYVNTYPELVAFGAAGQVEGFAYERITAVLCKAIQEQQALITSLTERITALEAK